MQRLTAFVASSVSYLSPSSSKKRTREQQTELSQSAGAEGYDDSPPTNNISRRLFYSSAAEPTPAKSSVPMVEIPSSQEEEREQEQDNQAEYEPQSKEQIQTKELEAKSENEEFCDETEFPIAPPVVDIEDTIKFIHKAACDRKENTYIDPDSGYKVFTGYFLEQRGSCCGSGCRHCPYNYVNVKNRTPKK